MQARNDRESVSFSLLKTEALGLTFQYSLRTRFSKAKVHLGGLSLRYVDLLIHKLRTWYVEKKNKNRVASIEMCVLS